MDRDGPGNLEEADQFEAVESLGAGLVVLDLGKACVDSGASRNQPVDVCEPEVPADPVHPRHDRGVHQVAVAELVDV